MAEKENPYQNAHAESLWSRLKAELLGDDCFDNLQDAHGELCNYIEGYCNIRRLHSALERVLKSIKAESQSIFVSTKTYSNDQTVESTD